MRARLQPTIAAETTGLGAAAILVKALGVLERGETLYTLQDQLAARASAEKQDDADADVSEEVHQRQRSTRASFPLREISAQSVRALATEAHDMIHGLLLARAEDPFAAAWRDELKRRTAAAIKVGHISLARPRKAREHGG